MHLDSHPDPHAGGLPLRHPANTVPICRSAAIRLPALAFGQLSYRQY